MIELSNKSRNLALASAATLAAGAAAGLGLLAYGVKGRSSQLLGPSIYQGRSSRRSIALTFDDGPSEQSLALLDLLARYSIRGTFFQCGMNVLRHPAIARSIAQAGHEIGNHTYSHPLLGPRLRSRPHFLSPSQVAEQFIRAQEIIVSEVGVTPVLLRPPYGIRWFGMRQVQRKLGLLGVMWTVIGRDWEWTAELVLSKASPGGIVCLHDGRDVQPNPDVTEMLKALEKIIPVLIDRGYHFETVSEIIKSTATEPPSPNHGSYSS